MFDKGLGTQEQVLIDIMGNRSNAQRIKIKDTYKLMFGKDLGDEFKSETSGNFQKLLVGLLMTPVEYDCMEMQKAMKGRMHIFKYSNLHYTCTYLVRTKYELKKKMYKSV